MIPNVDLNFSEKYPTTNAIIGNDSINPPVGPNIIPNPPLNPANTGNPIPPNNIYITCDINPNDLPKTKPHKATANTCIVNGTTGSGIDIWVNIAVKLAK